MTSHLEFTDERSPLEPAASDAESRRSVTSLIEGSEPASEDPGGSIAGLVMLLAGLLLLGWRFGWTTILVIAALLGMIFLHELGHYITAKRAGMQVTQFFLFFGPRVWSFQRGETEYGIRAIPLGAFVKITGMSNVEPVAPEFEERTYRQKSYGRRMSVAVAGSTMHFLIALVLIFGLLITEGPVWSNDGPPPVVGSLSAEGGALAAGVQEGDIIVSIDGTDIALFDDVGPAIRSLGSDTVQVVVDRGGEILELEATIGERLTETGAAAIDGALAGERILAVEGRPVASYDEFVSLVGDRIGVPITVTLDLRADPADYEIVVNEIVTLDATRGFFGVGADPTFSDVDSVAVLPAMGRTFVEFGGQLWASTKAIATTLWPPNLFSMFANVLLPDDAAAVGPRDQVRLEELGVAIEGDRLLSPVGAVNVGNQAFNDSLATFALFFMSINLFIGVFNLTPMLPFDGGHVLIATYEKLRSRKGRRYFADVTKLLPATYAVFALLLGIFILGLYLDISDPINF
ncbi:MAG: site-2 protease family protein [Acidimicrobiales bacterium]